MITGTSIEKAASVLRSGGLVAIPTETVYGLAANALDPAAVMQIFEAKKRPTFNPLIVHIADIAQLSDIAEPVPEPLNALLKTFWPGPLTILIPKKDTIHPLVTAGNSDLAVRIPDHPLTLELLRTLGFPLAAPSANLFGTVSPTTAAHVAGQFSALEGYILDGGPCSVGIESTIVKLQADGKVGILRHGGVSAEQLSGLLGYLPETVTALHDQPEAPGMLKSHYAPQIPLHLGNLDTLLKRFSTENVAVLTYSTPRTGQNIHTNKVLSPKGDLREAAFNLFDHLRILGASGAERILAEEVPETGIGKAINDRLTRASSV